MAIYAVRGACAAAYIAYGYKVYVEGFNPQLYFSDWKKNTRDGSVSSIVRELAQNMGLEKTL